MEKDNLKDLLLKIELFLKVNKIDEALILYQKLNKNWNFYKNSITTEKEKNLLLRLVNYIDSILREKKTYFLECSKFLELRKKYSKY
ncbi:hypothetical protein DRN73_01125 [Candidatus Pacearchaeota archaeon]|nr:MAG: hypothetical protein DRN73_01125 [Candidatus Pacearchaeota archaeon]